jgi:hypothetical protein
MVQRLMVFPLEFAKALERLVDWLDPWKDLKKAGVWKACWRADLSGTLVSAPC